MVAPLSKIATLYLTLQEKERALLNETNETSNKGLSEEENMKEEGNENLEVIAEKEETRAELVRFQFDGELQMEVSIIGDKLNCTDTSNKDDSFHILPYMTVFSVRLSFKFEITKELTCNIVDSTKYNVMISSEVGVDEQDGWAQFYANIADEESRKMITRCSVDKPCTNIPIVHDMKDDGSIIGNAHVVEYLATGKFCEVLSCHLKYDLLSLHWS